ncbi:DUF4238 domain-containing protein [Streptomyces mirabilis]|uniref:DUF4238 domain-containing protein n=1 Tax=Streptomyces mirabilis TaxID=68239 RepID=UPI0036B9469C
MAPMVDAYESGALLRVRIEASFTKIRNLLDGLALQILRPGEGEFLIGDTPAVTVRRDGPMVSYNMAFGDCHTIILPISPAYVLSIGPEPAYLSVPRAQVDELNTLQIRAARRYVYTRPGSTLRPFIAQQIRTSRMSSERLTGRTGHRDEGDARGGGEAPNSLRPPDARAAFRARAGDTACPAGTRRPSRAD